MYLRRHDRKNERQGALGAVRRGMDCLGAFAGHDAFWMYRRALARFVGSGTGNALEVGCGEGRISRELKRLGYRVTATDAVAALVEASRQAN
jgi:2-polyprenyl-3-methyl-5-hydroxy-6-metoxy-1,4-benzoquinol methylase